RNRIPVIIITAQWPCNERLSCSRDNQNRDVVVFAVYRGIQAGRAFCTTCVAFISSVLDSSHRKALNLQSPKKTELSFPHIKNFCATMPLCSSLLKLSIASATALCWSCSAGHERNLF